MGTCSRCGAAQQGGRFCSRCGTALAAVPGSGAQPGSGGQPGWWPAALRGWPWPDAARDVLAGLALLAALGQVWSFGGVGATRPLVVLATLVSLASLVLPHLHRTGGLAPALAGRLPLVRLLAAVPYLVVVAVVLVADAVGGLTGSVGPVAAGVGTGLGTGLAGALLAAQPRRAAPEADPRGPRRVAVGVLAVLGVLVLARPVEELLTSAVRTVTDGYGASYGLQYLALVLTTVLVLVGIPGPPLLATLLRGSAGARSALVALGACVAAWSLLGTGGQGGLPYDGAGATGYGVALWVPLAVAASSPALPLRPAVPGGAARAVLAVLAVVCGLATLSEVVQVSTFGTVSAAGVVTVLTDVAVLVLALLARARLHPRAAAGPALVLVSVAAGLGVLGLLVALGEASQEVLSGGFPVERALVLGLAVAALLVLTAPRWAPALAGGHGARPPGGAAGPADDTPTGPVAVPPGPEARAAADPSTPLVELARLAHLHPAVRPAVATNPAAYPDLLTWLGGLGDPAVDAALRSRSGS